MLDLIPVSKENLELDFRSTWFWTLNSFCCTKMSLRHAGEGTAGLEAKNQGWSSQKAEWLGSNSGHSFTSLLELFLLTGWPIVVYVFQLSEFQEPFKAQLKCQRFPPALPCANRYPSSNFCPFLLCAWVLPLWEWVKWMSQGWNPVWRSEQRTTSWYRFKHVWVISHAEAAESRGMTSGFRTRDPGVTLSKSLPFSKL